MKDCGSADFRKNEFFKRKDKYPALIYLLFFSLRKKCKTTNSLIWFSDQALKEAHYGGQLNK
jgi:hypothetical protein